MWRFIREMKEGDLVVVPHGPEFYIAEVDGPATYDPSFFDDDTAYRRPVIWLNNKNPIPRNLARVALISRMKTYAASSYATDLLDEIKECLEIAELGGKPTFQTDLQSSLAKETLKQIRHGRMNPDKFERLVRSVLIGLGAKKADIRTKNYDDKGADVVATFLIAGHFSLIVAVQAKHWQPVPPVGKDVVEQLIRGIEAEGANLGMVITAGTISDEATTTATQYSLDKGIKIELVNGEEFAKLIVEHGIGESYITD